MPLSPPLMLEARGGTKFQLLLLFNIVGPVLGLARNLGAHHMSSCKDTWYMLNDSWAQEQDRITMASPKMYKKILGCVYNQITRKMFEYKTT
jgi:hypothetical protein